MTNPLFDYHSEVEESECCPYVTLFFHNREKSLRFENVWGYGESSDSYFFNYISQSTGEECRGEFMSDKIDCILLGGDVYGYEPKKTSLKMVRPILTLFN